ncbi:M16 family metallopeptidase [Sphingomonas sp.]|uniref:M16 family metallopeptidase n=1 Tax=Sphingomonas sp. TaxID=28214 RepID=UPI0035BBB0AD
MHSKALALTGIAFLAFAAPAFAQTMSALAPAPAPVATLVKAIDIPYTQFTLANGLRVVVHTDRKAPVVAVSVWYDVGSKHEPAGKTGFAHLFEHLMFNGSENAPGDFFEPLKQVGATDYNGTTYFDRTNYFETVPTAALDRALFLESDRMGYLTGAITQAVLDEQRGVVQNEKRSGDNQPYGLVRYKLTEGLFPATHPYGHTTIGSMADLDAASLADVKAWFRDHYGPNNAVLVLAGDIDLATAKRLTTKYFGAIPAGPRTRAVEAPVPVLSAPRTEVMKDRVAATLVLKTWAVPGLNDTESVPLDVAASVLGGLASSRLDNALVKREKLAVQVGAGNSAFAQVGTFTVNAVVRPGVDAALVSKRIDEIVAEFLKTGPTADEVQRVVTSQVSRRIGGLESVGGFGGKAVALAEGALYSNDPGFYKVRLARLAAQTPATVKAAADKWLTRPGYMLSVISGPRDAYAEAVVPPAIAVAAAPTPAFKGTRGPLPAVGPVAGLTFPKVERTKLSNGIELIYAQRDVVPVTQAVLSFDAGVVADVADKLGTQQLTLAMMDEGTAKLDSIALAEAKERLGADIFTSGWPDRSTLSLRVPTANLAAAASLWAEIARAPAFPQAELGRAKSQQLAGIAQELTSPDGLADRVLPPILYGAGNPYAKARGGGDPKAVAALTRADLVAFQQAWLRPDKAKLFVVSDLPLGEVRTAFDRILGDWKPTGTPGTKTFRSDRSLPAPRIILIDRPDSPQSLISAGLRTSLVGSDELLPLITANDALGGSFLGRINMDLRETRHWSYGASGNFYRNERAAPYVVRAAVQADKTGASIAAIRQDVGEFVTTKPLTQGESDRAIAGAINALPGNFETSSDVLGAMRINDLYRRPDDYYATITQKYRALTRDQLDATARAAIDPARFVWVVVGDAKLVRPQLDSLGLPVEIVPAASVAGDPGPAR